MTMLGEPIDRSFGTVTKRPPRVGPEVPIVVAKDLSVDYRTPDGRTRRALDGVSMTIRHGETIGTAGRSGCGKSTWLKALMRLIHPSGGSVLIGGVPIDVVSREDLGKLIGYVSQSPFVFAGTVAENISYGCEGVTRADVERAAKMAHIHDEIMEMPGGYDAMLSERGNNLSGGQRQRLALARLFLRNPPLLILDEGTSALDNISERKIQLAIAEARADRTIIMVAHRLSTLRDADRILVFDDGRVVEEGTYDELVHQGGLFTELVQSAGDAHA
jgi:ATP-binding cassette subfamily B protein